VSRSPRAETSGPTDSSTAEHRDSLAAPDEPTMPNSVNYCRAHRTGEHYPHGRPDLACEIG
jgi:hypothetical protein